MFRRKEHLRTGVGRQLLVYAALPLAYIIFGRLGLLLAVPPGYATAVFLPAGIAIAGMFMAGAATLPAVFGASFLLNLWIGYTHGLDGAGVATALLIAFASTVQAGVGRRLMARDPAQAASALESIESIGRTAQDELRVVLGLLRDEQAEAASLAPAPRLTDLKELAETVRDSGNPVDLRVCGMDRALSPSLELSLYRVVQEALTNVVKHAPGARTCVDLTVADSEVSLEVANEPGAPDVAGGAGAGHGIVGMRERVAAFGILTSMSMKGKALKCSAACSGDILTASMPRWRATASAMVRTGTPASVAPVT